ncbi:YggN family protein [Luteimonas sp. BDR2-5]|uniref:YggN family protein n=1 Tax=Proluteimonas luteida TaxID=2878685 RepID=UPI001E334CEF|nr:YggN family protein [Luteimonas sp. BDR2-5]MCD9028667.1 YggN family protein [Luteimonas sp. BDR2-5]
MRRRTPVATPARAAAVALLAGAALLSAACSRAPEPLVQVDGGEDVLDLQADASGSLLGDRDITLSAAGHPRVKVTAAGDFIVDGKPLDLSAEQRALVLAYRGEIDGVARKGVEIGKQGAAFGVSTAAAALRGAFSGDNADTQAKIEAEAERFKQQALAICDNVAAVKQAQDRLSAALPAFAPYAEIDDSDVDECGSDRSVARAVGRDGWNPAAEADAAAETAAE